MIRSFARLGDRLLQAFVPRADAAALNCTRGVCRNHKRLLCCVNYGCEYINC